MRIDLSGVKSPEEAKKLVDGAFESAEGKYIKSLTKLASGEMTMPKKQEKRAVKLLEKFHHEPNPEFRTLKRYAARLQKSLQRTNPLVRKLRGQAPRMSDYIPPGESGNVRVEHFVVHHQAAAVQNLKAAIQNRPSMGFAPGRYCKLIVDDKVMMSDAPHEWYTNQDILRHARGDVLIAGLGLGMILIPILQRKSVKRVTVIEKSPHVIKLVEPHIRKAVCGQHRLRIIQADIFKWEPDQKFETIYFDIWPSITQDNLPGMKELHRRYRPSLKKTTCAWMASWMYHHLVYQKRKDGRLEREVYACLPGGKDPSKFDLKGDGGFFHVDRDINPEKALLEDNMLEAARGAAKGM